MPWDDNIVATIVIGGALLIDGVFRLGSAIVIRSERWRQAVVVAALELVMAGLIWTPWPIPNRHTVPFCLGVILIAASGSLCRLGLQLRRLPPGASVTDLPLFAGPNWHGRGSLRAAQALAAQWTNDSPLTVHIWTPLGSAVDPERRPVIDRYIAAVDQNGVILTGHAALSLPPGTYVSLCPANDIDRSPDEFDACCARGRRTIFPENSSPRWRRKVPPGAGPTAKSTSIATTRRRCRPSSPFIGRPRSTISPAATVRPPWRCRSTPRSRGRSDEERPWRALFLLLTDPAMWLLALWRARAEAMTWTPGLVLDWAHRPCNTSWTGGISAGSAG